MPVNPFQDDTVFSFLDLGTETLVNIETTSNQQNPSVGVLSDGRILVAWESNLQDGADLGIYARVFAADGTALTGEFLVNETTASAQSQPEVHPLSNGAASVFWRSGGDLWYRGITASNTLNGGEVQLNGTSSANNYEVTPHPSQDAMVTWEASDGLGNSTGIFGQRLLFTGGEFWPEFRINAEVSGSQRRADTAELTSQQQFTVFQSQGQTSSPSDQGIYMRGYSNTSTLQGADDILIVDEVGVLETLPQIAALDGGGFVVTWVNATTQEIWAETFLNTGVVVGSTRTNISGAVGANTLLAPVVKGLPNDRYVVVWQNSSTLLVDLHYKVLEADGTTVTTGLLHTNTGGAQSDPQVHLLPQGGFITVYTSGSGTALDLFIVRHAEDGTPVGPPMQLEYPVNATTTNAQTAPDVAVSDEGEIVVVWQSNFQDGSGLGVYMQRFASPEVGTAAGDLIDGDAAADFIAGLDGNDTLRGQGGDDRLEGGNGEDRLIGGAGNDLLLGGADADHLTGGSNDDTLEGGAGADLLLGNGGSDTVLGEAGNDTLFGGAGTDSVSGGSGDDELSGQGAADTVLGGSGNDTLRGGSGSDSLQGGDDNDMLFGQGNNDTLEGGAGNDTLQGAAGSDDLRGEAGDDLLTGSVGADRLDGGSGNDTMNGGGADGVRDTFVFALGYEADRINAFDQAGTDLIELDQDLWTGAMPGLSEQQVVDTFGNLNGTGTILTLDFGGGDVLEVQNAGGITQATLGADILFV